jgi:L-amino acid N-acyltransferase YncA
MVTRMTETAIAMTPDDWESVRSIYGEGIATGNATFEEETPTWDAWDAVHLQPCRLVARNAETVVGWAALSPVSGRDCYRGVAELMIYVGERFRGGGVGRSLLRALIGCSEAQRIWTLQATVFPENEASLALLRTTGFRVVGVREGIARHRGLWRDVVLLERRSSLVGRD